MTRYEALLTLHIVAAIVWLGAALTLDLLVLKAERERDRLGQLAVYMQMEWLATRLFIPSSLAVLVFGVVLVLDSPWTFGQLWVVLGLLGWAFSFVLGFFFFKPEGERIGRLVEESGPHSPEVGRRVHRLNVFGRVELAVLFLVVVAMAAKPTGSNGWTLAAGAVVLVAVAAAAARALRAPQPAGDAVASDATG